MDGKAEGQRPEIHIHTGIYEDANTAPRTTDAAGVLNINYVHTCVLRRVLTTAGTSTAVAYCIRVVLYVQRFVFRGVGSRDASHLTPAPASGVPSVPFGKLQRPKTGRT